MYISGEYEVSYHTVDTAAFFELDHDSCGNGHRLFLQTKSETPAYYIGLRVVNIFFQI